MKEMNRKALLGLVLRNKSLITALMDRFQPADIERGVLAIPEAVVNRDIKMLAMEVADPYVADYAVLFQNNSIYLDLILSLKQLGRLRAKYMLTIEDFHFDEQERIIKCSYVEDVRSEGNFMQAMAFKAVGLKGSYLQSAVELARLDFLQVHGNKVIIHVDKIPGATKIPPSLSLVYSSCEDGRLVFHFDI